MPLADVKGVALRCGLGGGLAVEEIGDVDAVDLKHIAGIALAIRPDGRVAETGIGADTVLQFGTDAGRQNRETGEAAGGERRLLDLLGVEHVTVGGVDRVEQGLLDDFNGSVDAADLEDDVDGAGAILLHRNAGDL